jgi:hypothetical protein
MTRQKVQPNLQNAFVIFQAFTAMIVQILIFSVWEFVVLEVVTGVTQGHVALFFTVEVRFDCQDGSSMFLRDISVHLWA